MQKLRDKVTREVTRVPFRAENSQIALAVRAIVTNVTQNCGVADVMSERDGHPRAVHTVSLLPEQVITLISCVVPACYSSRIYIVVSHSENGEMYLRTKIGFIAKRS